MTNQEVFDKVLAHLRQQGRASFIVTGTLGTFGDITCMYRSDSGDMCAVGCLIPDELYSLSMEESTIDDVLAKSPTLQQLFDGVDFELLSDLQFAHDMLMPKEGYDDSEISMWEYEMAEIATKYGLMYHATN